jgi:hypothetical protein
MCLFFKSRLFQVIQMKINKPFEREKNEGTDVSPHHVTLQLCNVTVVTMMTKKVCQILFPIMYHLDRVLKRCPGTSTDR